MSYNISISTSKAATAKGEITLYSFDVIKDGKKIVASTSTSNPQKAKGLLAKMKKDYDNPTVNGKPGGDPFADGTFHKQSDFEFGGFGVEDESKQMSYEVTEKTLAPIESNGYRTSAKKGSPRAGKSNLSRAFQDISGVAEKRLVTWKTKAGTSWDSMTSDQRKKVGLNGTTRLQAMAVRPKADSEWVKRGPDNNAFIIIGNDRVDKLHTGYGGGFGTNQGFTHCDAIDIVAGLGSSTQRADGAYGPTEFVLDEKGKPKFDSNTGAPEKAEMDPNFFNDAARIYISQRTNVDKNFGIGPWAKGKKTQAEIDDAENIGKYGAKSAVAVKADNIRVIGRESLRLVTGTDQKNSQGGDISGKSGIEIIAMNDIATLQPMVLGDNLQLALITIVNNIEAIAEIFNAYTKYQMKFNAAVQKHTHITPFFGKPALQSKEAIIAGIKCDIETFGKTELSVVKHITNLQGVKHNFLTDSGDGFINSRLNKVN